MTYFFILGSNPTLSTAELLAFFAEYQDFKLISKDVLLLHADAELPLADIITRLGGTIKVGVVFDTVNHLNTEFVINKVRNILKPGPGKFKFGLSFYGRKNINLKPLGMEIKKFLKEQQVSCRWVTGKEKVLSSVIVEQNKLTDNGAEIVILEEGGKYHLGHTVAVQAFKSLSFRDYGRPARDDHSGMLPPKLAQIMLNLSRADKKTVILDPFCGSGTILTEALLMGFEQILGSDLSAKAVSDAQDNIRWIMAKYQLTGPIPKTQVSAAQKISQTLQPGTVSAIVSEPFLGQQRGQVDFKKQTQELEQLYSEALQDFKKILKPSGVVVILFPVFFNKHFINPSLSGYQIVSPLTPALEKNPLLQVTARQTIVYGRSGQKVFREIVILKKS